MASSQDLLREQYGTPIWISYSVNLGKWFHITHYVCTGILFLDFHDLLVNETKHQLDLAVKQGLDFFACFLSKPRIATISIHQGYLLRKYHLRVLNRELRVMVPGSQTRDVK